MSSCDIIHLQDAVSRGSVLGIHGEQLLDTVLGLRRDAWPGGSLEVNLTLHSFCLVCPLFVIVLE